MTIRRTVASLLLACGALAVSAAPASAHTELKSSDPAANSSAASVQQVTLTFTEPVTLPADAVTVTGPEGATWTVGTAAVAGPVVTAPVQASGPAGQYQITWKVVSADGDPVAGTIPFTLTEPATVPTSSAPATTTSEPAPTSASGSVSQQSPAEQENGFPMWAWILIGVAVVAAAVGGFLVKSRKSQG